MKVDRLLDAYGYSDLQAYYQVESRFCHVSLTAVQSFARRDGQGPHLAQRSTYEELVPCCVFCLTVLFKAMLAFNQLLTGRPWAQALAQVAADHGLSTSLPTRHHE